MMAVESVGVKVHWIDRVLGRIFKERNPYSSSTCNFNKRADGGHVKVAGCDGR